LEAGQRVSPTCGRRGDGLRDDRLRDRRRLGYSTVGRASNCWKRFIGFRAESESCPGMPHDSLWGRHPNCLNRATRSSGVLRFVLLWSGAAQDDSRGRCRVPTIHAPCARTNRASLDTAVWIWIQVARPSRFEWMQVDMRVSAARACRFIFPSFLTSEPDRAFRSHSHRVQGV
jgi:hypothetical protein